MATAVTMFQVAIAMGAIAVLTRMRLFWFISLALGVIGALSFARGALSTSHAAEAPAHVHAQEPATPGRPAGAEHTPAARPADEAQAAPAAGAAAPGEPAAPPPAAAPR
jgi:hypothetical protein